jgi:2-oxoglutarate dehydrogenase E2 component (dihydrolipoamide succinyltransferase)
MIDIKVPTVGESISEVTLLKWTRKDGDYVERDEVIAELESEKATFEVNAEKAGVLKLGSIKEGDTLKIGDVLAAIDETAAKPEKAAAASSEPAPAKKEEAKPVSSTAASASGDIKAKNSYTQRNRGENFKR